MFLVASGLRRKRLLGLLLGALAWGLYAAPAMAQAPFLNLGIYGGVPDPELHRGEVVAARLTHLSHSAPPLQISVPLNGLLNYSFYYVFTQHLAENRFLPAGEYWVDYLDVFGHVFPAGTVFYNPNRDFTNGVQVPGNPPNTPPWDIIPVMVLGVQGTVSYTVGPSTQKHPLKNVRVELLSASTGERIESVVTNGKGLYTFYYTFGAEAGFLPPGSYVVRVALFGAREEQKVSYTPDTDLTAMGYYVLGARAIADFTFAAP